MNPLQLYQYLIQNGYPPQQAWSIAQQSMGGGPGASGPFAGATPNPSHANPGAGWGYPAAGAQPGQASQGRPGGDGLYGIADMIATALAGYQGSQMMQQPWDQQRQAAQIGMDPGMLNQRIQAMTQPMSNQLVKSVTRATTPGIAEAGLAT